MKLNIDEMKAANAASEEVGGYLERIGKTDLSEMSEAEWLGFIQHAYACVCGQVYKIWENEVPF